MDKTFLNVSEILDTSQSISKNIFNNINYPWEALPLINKFIIEISKSLSADEYVQIKPFLWVSKSAEINDTAFIQGPAIIQKNAQIRHCAYVRGNAIIGENCVVGNSTELKNVILFNNVQVPHYNYVGDSILGYKSHLGAGAITSNVRSDKSNISLKFEGNNIDTKLRKFGAIVGDYCEIGCNAVLNPGTILHKNCTVYPTSMVRGIVKENYIFKNDGTMTEKINF